MANELSSIQKLKKGKCLRYLLRNEGLGGGLC